MVTVDPKAFAGLERIVILLRTQKEACKMIIAPIPKEQVSRDARTRIYAELLRKELENTSKSTPVVPKVRVAYLKVICKVPSPYSY